MHKVIYLFLSLYSALAIQVPSATKEYRKDYVYNKKTDAFYKLHIETVRTWRARDSCTAEGASLMLPASSLDIAQAHAMFKRYPDLGEYLWIGDDGKNHESAEEDPIIDLTNTEEPDTKDGICEVLTRRGEIETYHCYRELPFICKVQASDAPYSKECNVYSHDYKYNATTGSCYKLSNVIYAWGQAAAECEAEGAHLAIINSMVEKDAVWEVTKKAPPTIEGAKYSWFFLLGFRAHPEQNNEKERTFMTIYNETLDQAGYNEWSPNEPNNYMNTENCGSIFKNDGKLNDVDCQENYPFLCEKEINAADIKTLK